VRRTAKLNKFEIPWPFPDSRKRDSIGFKCPPHRALNPRGAGTTENFLKKERKTEFFRSGLEPFPQGEYFRK
jgi:hypothetical protein